MKHICTFYSCSFFLSFPSPLYPDVFVFVFVFSLESSWESLYFPLNVFQAKSKLFFRLHVDWWLQPFPCVFLYSRKKVSHFYEYSNILQWWKGYKKCIFKETSSNYTCLVLVCTTEICLSVLAECLPRNIHLDTQMFECFMHQKFSSKEELHIYELCTYWD